jgi:hypothetical protein
MDVNPSLVEVEFFFDRDETAAKHRTGNQGEYSGAAGLYFSKASQETRRKIAINVSQFKNPMSLVATIAHELGHVILLGGGKISHDDKDHEYLTDLITVFFGLGIFTANSAFQFSQWQDHSHQGWSASFHKFGNTFFRAVIFVWKEGLLRQNSLAFQKKVLTKLFEQPLKRFFNPFFLLFAEW